MTNHKVSFELQSRVRKYLEYTMKNTANMKEEKLILDKLNKSLKDELLIESLGRIIKAVPFFKDNFSENSLENLVFALRKRQLSPEEFLFKVKIFNLANYYFIIFKENTLDENSLFILNKGHLEEVHAINNDSYMTLDKIKVSKLLFHLLLERQEKF